MLVHASTTPTASSKTYCPSDRQLRSWKEQERHQAFNISRLLGDEIVHHSDVVGASAVGAAPASFSAKHLASIALG